MKTEHVILRISGPIWEMCQSDWEAVQVNVPKAEKLRGAEKNHSRTKCGNNEPIMPAPQNNTWPASADQDIYQVLSKEEAHTRKSGPEKYRQDIRGARIPSMETPASATIITLKKSDVSNCPRKTMVP